MAGHSHWKQVKHKKGASDVKRGQVFSKLIREITIAVREGGPNPDANPRLRAAMERARSEGLPKENIERATERASGKGESGELTEFLYEASAPGGVAILIEGITDNGNRTLAEIKHILTEHGARLAESGSLIWGFEKIALIECRAEDNPAKTKEEIELAIIESGASDFRALDNAWLAEAAFGEGQRVREALQSRGIAAGEPVHDYESRAPLTPEPSRRAKIEPLLNALTEYTDVQEVYTNLDEGFRD